jgi:DNA-directed RNA polymerase subunit RPC12/RpoP
MTVATCSKCGNHLESPWKFCPSCGSVAVEPPAPHPHEREKAPAKYGFIGLFFGLIAAPVFILYGGMICLLGPWMVVGIPMILLGIACPILGPYLAINATRGECPWCGTKINSIGPLDAFYCHACSQKIVVREHHMVRAESEHPAGVQPAA